MKKSLVILMIMSVSIVFVACCCSNESSSGKDYYVDSEYIESNSDIDSDYIESNSNIEENNSEEDSLSGIWSVIEGADEHIIIIANGNIQIIDGNNSAICKYTKPSENVFKFDFDEGTWELKYDDGLLYRYENGELDGYVYERTAYNSNK